MALSLTSMLKLIPFIASIGLYFTLFLPEDIPSLWSTIVKCLPILSLALFTALHDGYVKKRKINRKILAGLLFSCFGDACLVWPEYFVHGIGSFAVAQILFINAAGLEAINLKLGFILIPYATTVLYLIKPGVLSQPMILAAAVSLYSPILLGRVWLVCSKLLRNTSNCTTVWAAVGAMSFMVSDSYLSLNRFYTTLPYHQEVVMITYYFAQAAATFTILYQSPENIKKKK